MENPLFSLDDLNHKAWALSASNAVEGLELALQVQNSLPQVEWDKMQPAEQAVLAESLKNQAYCCEALGQYGEALVAGLRGLELAQKTGLFNCVAALDGILGSICWHLGDFTNAIDYFFKGLSILQDHPDREIESMLNNGLGAVHSSMGIFPEAYKFYLVALELAPQDDTLTRAAALNNIGFFLHQMGQYEQALEYALQSVAEFDRAQCWIGKSHALETLGSIYLTLGQEERAFEAYRVGLELARQGENRGQEINNLFGMAKLQQLNGDMQAAMRTLLEILEIAQAIGSKQEEANANEKLAGICKQQGNYQDALHYFENFHSISLKLNNEKAERRMQLLQVQYEVESIRKQADQYRELASTDSLTGLLNRRRFFELAERSLQTAQAERLPLGVMMLDIDNFKQVNDLYGHHFGDVVLGEVASRLRQSLRPDDWSGRYGGDELVVVLNHANCETARTVAERLRQAVIREAITFGAVRLDVTISLGVACTDGSQKLNLSELVERADQAMMRAKQAGRNQVMLYEA